MPWESKAQARYICMEAHKRGGDPEKKKKLRKMCREYWAHTPKSLWKRLPENKPDKKASALDSLELLIQYLKERGRI